MGTRNSRRRPDPGQQVLHIAGLQRQRSRHRVQAAASRYRNNILRAAGTAVHRRPYHALSPAAVHGGDLAGHLQQRPREREESKALSAAGHYTRRAIQRRRQLDSLPELQRIPVGARPVSRTFAGLFIHPFRHQPLR